MAIRPLGIVARNGDEIAFRINAGELDADVAEFPAIRARIHDGGAPDSAGNAGGEFEAGKTRLQSRLRNLAVGRACLGADDIPIDGDFRQIAQNLHHDTAHSGIRDKKVASLAQDAHGGKGIGAYAMDPRKVFDTLRDGIHIGGAADSERRMLAQRFAKQDVITSKHILQSRNQCLLLIFGPRNHAAPIIEYVPGNRAGTPTAMLTQQ